ncbi:MAG: S8 family peptidase [Candidatus Puniceispirillaceae bacterium]
MGDKRFVFCGLAMAQRGHACAIFAAYIVIAAGLSACGGGGSGAGPAPSSDQVIKVTQPPIYRSSLRTPLSFGSGYDTEYQRQIGLTQIGAAAAYDAGYAGFNVKIGIVDTGIDGTHSEIDHIAGGKDFHGNSLGLEDPDGHGTHVASLLVAKRNSLKMHGVAPHASPFSYRIFDGHGTFGSKTGGQTMPSLVSDARHKQIDILNHSWASHYEITDLSKSVISSSLGAELPAWRAAVDDGMALIWAAGNEGDDDVSIRAGLPYHFSDLRKGWLAVVSLDPDGKEPRYTNRCGVAKNWCLAAPGGGDIPFHSGLYGAKSGGGYENVLAPLWRHHIYLVRWPWCLMLFRKSHHSKALAVC